jgi:hypothetical protein
MRRKRTVYGGTFIWGDFITSVYLLRLFACIVWGMTIMTFDETREINSSVDCYFNVKIGILRMSYADHDDTVMGIAGRQVCLVPSN